MTNAAKTPTATRKKISVTAMKVMMAIRTRAANVSRNIMHLLFIS